MSNEHVPVSLPRRVRLRAGERCEYCRLSQVSQEAAFRVDQVVPRIADGTSAMGTSRWRACPARRQAARTVVTEERRARLTLRIDQVRGRESLGNHLDPLGIGQLAHFSGRCPWQPVPM